MRPAVAVLAALICALIALQADAQLAVRRTTARALRLALPTTSRRPTTTRTATTSRTKTATRTRTSTTKPVKLNPTPPAAPFLYNGYDADGQIIKTADDGVATIMWAGNKTLTGQWLVTWGVVNGTMKTIPSPYNTIQLQPLEPGVLYQMSVQTVNATGHVSIPSSVLTFQSDSTRVDELRASYVQNGGFFDDFNIKPGAPDELNWRTSYIYCDDPAYNAIFVNAQKHVHNVVSTWDMSPQSPTLKDIYIRAIAQNDKRMLGALAASKKVCDQARGQVVARTTQVLDFTDGEATIVFDFDGAFGSNYWFLDFIEPGTGEAFTALHQAGDRFKFFYTPVNRNDSGVIENKPARIGITLIRNVRRHFVLKVTRDTMSLTLDGRLLLHSDFALTRRTPLPATRAFLTFRQTTKRTRQEQNLPFLTVHWDNFGMSRTTPESRGISTHVYNITDRSAAYPIVGLGQDTNKMNFTIPDIVAGATKARLHYGYSGSMPHDLDVQHVFINGYKVPLVGDGVIDGIGVFTEFDPAYLVQGVNRLRWWLPRQQMRVGNVRIELEFPVDAAPSYTQPKAWFEPMESLFGHHAIKERVGLSATVKSIGPYGTGPQGDGGPPFLFGPYDSPQGANLEYNSTYTISYGLNCGIQLVALGRCYGARNISLYLKELGTADKPTLLDRYVFQTPGTPGGLGAGTPADYGVINWGNTLKLNTGILKNGTTYEIWVEAFDAIETPAIPEYYDGSHYTGERFPVFIYAVNKPLPEDPPSPLAATDVPPVAIKNPSLLGEAAANGNTTSANSPVDPNATGFNGTVPSRRKRDTTIGYFSRLASPVPPVRMTENEIAMISQLHKRAVYEQTADGHFRGVPQVLEVHPEVVASQHVFEREQREDAIEDLEAELAELRKRF